MIQHALAASDHLQGSASATPYTPDLQDIQSKADTVKYGSYRQKGE